MTAEWAAPKKPAPAITSTFALLDVMKGRHALARRVLDHEKFDVVIRGRLVRVHSAVVGASIEFQVDVSGVELKEI